jgi:hypothetical protein
VDFIYICRSGNNEELRYSIRSVVKHFKDANIWLIGHKPDWYTGNFKSVQDVGGKFNNINNCIKQICSIDQIDNNFVLMNDDFFFLKPMDEIKIYHSGLLMDKINNIILEVGQNSYTRLLLKTHKQLNKLGIAKPLDFDIHTPMPMQKDLLFKTIDQAYFPRSAYGNLAKVKSEKISSDVKVYTKNRQSYDYLSGDLPFVSTLDESFEQVYNDILKEMLPDPSQYEMI